MTLPGFHVCGECGGDGDRQIQYSDGSWSRELEFCRECGGAGQVPDDDTVERVARAIEADLIDEAFHAYLDSPPGPTAKGVSRAALLAYARHTQETKP